VLRLSISLVIVSARINRSAKPHLLTVKTHPIEAAAIGALAACRLARAVIVPAVCLLLTVAGWQPKPSEPAWLTRWRENAIKNGPPGSHPEKVWRATAGSRYGACHFLTVTELRQLARAAGFRSLARSGRRADLLAALAA
jgi:hypothetical protein